MTVDGTEALRPYSEAWFEQQKRMIGEFACHTLGFT